MQADEDVLVIPRYSGHPLDRSSSDGLPAKWGIDATVPLNWRDDFTRVRYRDLERVLLKDYVGS